MSALNSQLAEFRITAELVRAAQSGSRAAFGELFERFQPTIFAIAMRRLGNTADAQELVQDVFLQAMTKLDQLRTPECFIGWLRQITVRMAINRGMRRQPSLAVEPEILESTLTVQQSPVADALASERKEHVHDGLSRLRELDRETLEAFYVQGQSLIEMSDQFDAPVGTIKRRLHTARKRLAKEVEELVEV
jgi:RNA polymerase sigma-70 factor (ECF subfamily)